MPGLAPPAAGEPQEAASVAGGSGVGSGVGSAARSAGTGSGATASGSPAARGGRATGFVRSDGIGLSFWYNGNDHPYAPGIPWHDLLAQVTSWPTHSYWDDVDIPPFP